MVSGDGVASESEVEGYDVVCLMQHRIASDQPLWYGHHRHPGEKLGNRQYCCKRECEHCDMKLLTVSAMNTRLNAIVSVY